MTPSTLKKSLSYKAIRYQLDEYFLSLVLDNPEAQIPYSSQSFGSFDRTAQDWEIQSPCHHDAMTIILGIQHIFMSY